MRRRLTYKSTAISCYIGFAVQSIINNFPSLLFVIFRKSFGITISELASLVSILFLTQLAVDVFSIKYVDRMGYRMTALVSHAFSAGYPKMPAEISGKAIELYCFLTKLTMI